MGRYVLIAGLALLNAAPAMAEVSKQFCDTLSAAKTPDVAWVHGKVENIKGEWVYLKDSDGKQVKLRRAWVEKSDKDFRPGQTMRVEVNFEEFMQLNSD